MSASRRAQRTALSALALAVTLAAATLAAHAAERFDYRQSIYRALSERPFADVIDDVEFAIVEHNFRITGRNRIGGAIAERHGIPFPEAEVIHFCNLEFAREMLQQSVDFLVYMPCKIAVYEHDGKTVVEAPLVPTDIASTKTAAERVNAILTAIVDFAAEE